jgi:hypothetical protein
MIEGWEGLSSPQTAPLDVTQKKDDTDRLILRIFGSEDGQQFMEWLIKTYTDQPVAVPGCDPSYAFYREGQNSVVRDFVARIIRARSL